MLFLQNLINKPLQNSKFLLRGQRLLKEQFINFGLGLRPKRLFQWFFGKVLKQIGILSEQQGDCLERLRLEPIAWNGRKGDRSRPPIIILIQLDLQLGDLLVPVSEQLLQLRNPRLVPFPRRRARVLVFLWFNVRRILPVWTSILCSFFRREIGGRTDRSNAGHSPWLRWSSFRRFFGTVGSRCRRCFGPDFGPSNGRKRTWLRPRSTPCLWFLVGVPWLLLEERSWLFLDCLFAEWLGDIKEEGLCWKWMVRQTALSLFWF